MKKNCYEGKIGWCRGPTCSCPMELTASPGGATSPGGTRPTKPQIEGVSPDLLQVAPQ
jgi:hypothetical protein